MKLRPYQQAAVDAVYDYLRQHEDNPCVVLPTAGGKTPVIATICRDAVSRWRGRVLILAHVKELLSQAAEKLAAVAPDLDVGVYSAGLGVRETEGDVLIAGIQSVYQRAAELGAFDLVLVDECHLIPTQGEGLYQRFLTEATSCNPKLRVIGFTATPYRLDSGPICSPQHFLNQICYQVGVLELIRDGFLCRPIAKAGVVKADASNLRVRGGDFIPAEAEALMNTESLVASACREIVESTKQRNSCLIFAAGVEHARSVVQAMQLGMGVDCELITGSMPTSVRDQRLTDFRQGRLKYLVNVNVLTTGFDAPAIDCVALLRPTMSPGLFYQMIGRGFRLDRSKKDCLILDFAGNVLRHGPVDQLSVTKKSTDSCSRSGAAKECQECRSLVASGYSQCPVCGVDFIAAPNPPHHGKSSGGGILSSDTTIAEYEVQEITYRVHTKRNAADDSPSTMRVDYRLGLDHWQSEFICVEHSGYAREKAEAWWSMRSQRPMPHSAQEAVEIALSGEVAASDYLTIRSIPGEPYDTITGYKIAEVQRSNQLDTCEVPF